MSFHSELTILERSSDELVATCNVTDAHSGFDGHFDSFPIFPGICQVDIVNDMATELLGPITISKISGCKFKMMLKPNSRLKISLRVIDSSTLKWKMKKDDDICSQGTLKYVTAD